MDIYSLTRKKRPSQLTIVQPSPVSTPDSSSALDNFVSKTSMSNPMSNPMSKEATGPPTRDHWKPDSEANNCGFLGCPTNFGLFDRRHHCRKCGDIFCSAHCSSHFRLDQYVQFHLQGTLSRGCNTCAEEYNRWQEELRRPKNKENKDNSRNRLSLKKRHAGIMTQQPQAMEGVTELGRDDIVSKGVNINKSTKKEQAFHPIPSVPTDWQWSTF